MGQLLRASSDNWLKWINYGKKWKELQSECVKQWYISDRFKVWLLIFISIRTWTSLMAFNGLFSNFLSLELGTFDVKGTSTPSQNNISWCQSGTQWLCANGNGTCNPIKGFDPPVFQNEDGQQLNSLQTSYASNTAENSIICWRDQSHPITMKQAVYLNWHCNDKKIYKVRFRDVSRFLWTKSANSNRTFIRNSWKQVRMADY